MPEPATTTNNPYVGPRTFEEQDKDRFFGREREARELLALVIGERLTLFYAQSGAGKSSLINTRLIPALRDEGFDVLPVGRVSGELPAGLTKVNNLFIFNLIARLNDALPPEEHQSPTVLAAMTLTRFLGGADNAAATTTVETAPTVLIIDQFEEILTSHLDQWPLRADFFQQLRAAQEQFPNVWIVLVMREDYVAGLDPYIPLLADRLHARFYMQRMTYPGALAAMTRPAAEIGQRPFAPGVAEELVDNLRLVQNVWSSADQTELVKGEFVEPVQLQVVCFQLWENLGKTGRRGDKEIGRQGDTDEHSALRIPDSALLYAYITRDDLTALAGEQGLAHFVNQALAAYYEQALQKVLQIPQINVSEREVRDWFSSQLITQEETRGLVHQGNETEGAGGLPNAAVKVLADQFLIRAESRAGGIWYELVHDRFVQPILQANRAWAAAHQHPLNLAAATWDTAGRPERLLLSGSVLTEASNQVKAQPDEFNDITHEFVAASTTLARQRQTRQQRIFIGALVGVSIILLVLTLSALRSATQATHAEATAEAAVTEVTNAQATTVAERDVKVRQSEIASLQRLAYQSLVDVTVNPQLNTLVLIDTITRRRQLNALVPSIGLQQFYNTLSAIGGLPLTIQQGAVNTVRFSPDERWLATAGEDHIVRLWDVIHPFTAPITLTGHIASISHLVFSPDGRWLASGSKDGTIRLWDLTLHPPTAQSLAYIGTLNFMAFSPKGRWLVATTSDSPALLWDMQTVQQVVSPHSLAHEYGVSAVFSADEQTLAAIASGQVKIWRAADHFTTPEVIKPDGSAVVGLAMSQDGRWLAIGTERILEVREIGTTPGGATNNTQQFVSPYDYTIAFSPDARFLSNGSMLWQLGADHHWSEPSRLNGQPPDGVGSPVFSQDSHWLAALGSDYSAYRWDTQDFNKAPYIYRGHEAPINAITFSASGQWLATASRDGMARLWRAANPNAMPLLLHHEETGDTVHLWNMRAANPAQDTHLVGTRLADFHLVAISPDGRYVALAYSTRSETVFLWDTTKPLVQPLSLNHKNVVITLAFSPDGHWLAVGDWSGVARLWDLSTPDTVGMVYIDLSHKGAAVRSLAFNGDGSLLVTGANDGIVRIWRVNLPDPTQKMVELRGHSSLVPTVAISHSGRWVLSGSWEPDLTARLWDLQQADPAAHPVIVRSNNRWFVSGFSPNEQWAAVGSWDSTAELINLAKPNAPPIVLAQHRGRILSMAFSPDNHWLATSGEDQRLILWDLTAANPATAFVVLRSPTGSGTGVPLAFSPDGRWLAGFGAAAFSANGAWLATADNDVHLWNLRLDELIDTACVAAGRNLSAEEWQRYFPEQSYRVICPATAQNPLVQRLQAQERLHDGDQLAMTGQLTEALPLYQQATTLDPALAISTTQAARQRALITLLTNGKALAIAGETVQASKLFTVAQQFEPALKLEPQVMATQMRAAVLAAQARTTAQAIIEQGQTLAEQGHYTESAILYLKVLTLTMDTLITANDLNEVCWQGALHGASAGVLPACDKAVTLAPDDGGIRDSRGLARALTGDDKGALEDYKAFVAWAKGNPQYEEAVKEREAWIKRLEAGENPKSIFDAAMLGKLKGE